MKCNIRYSTCLDSVESKTAEVAKWPDTPLEHGNSDSYSVLKFTNLWFGGQDQFCIVSITKLGPRLIEFKNNSWN